MVEFEAANINMRQVWVEITLLAVAFFLLILFFVVDLICRESEYFHRAGVLVIAASIFVEYRYVEALILKNLMNTKRAGEGASIKDVSSIWRGVSFTSTIALFLGTLITGYGDLLVDWALTYCSH